jgi:hypothetical protein
VDAEGQPLLKSHRTERSETKLMWDSSNKTFLGLIGGIFGENLWLFKF